MRSRDHVLLAVVGAATSVLAAAAPAAAADDDRGAANAAVVLAESTVAAPGTAESDSASEIPATPMLRGFLRDRDGDFSTITPPRAVAVKVGGLNDHGDVVGIGYPSSTENTGGFGFIRDRKGRYTTFLAPGTGPESRTVASDINNRGQVAGWSDDDRRSFGYIRDRDGTFIKVEHPNASGTVPIGLGEEIAGSELRGINNRGDAVGNFGADRTVYGFVRDRRGTFTLIRPPRAAATLVTGINDHGDIVGMYSTIGSEDLLVGAPRAFLYRDGVYRDIAVPMPWEPVSTASTTRDTSPAPTATPTASSTASSATATATSTLSTIPTRRTRHGRLRAEQPRRTHRRIPDHGSPGC